MSVLTRLASAQGRKDEEPNKELARELVEQNDLDGVREVAENLWNEDKQVRVDCLSVLEQVGLLRPEMIEDYAGDFLELLFSKDNRLVWAAMINLALVADRKPDPIFAQHGEIIQVIDNGSVITCDNGIKALAKVAAARAEYAQVIMPYLLEQLGSCRAKSVAQYAESIRVAVGPEYQGQYLDILNGRLDELSTAQQRRVNRLLKAF